MKTMDAIGTPNIDVDGDVAGSGISEDRDEGELRMSITTKKNAPMLMVMN